MKGDLEKGLAELDGFMKNSYGILANNAGKAIAIITVIVAALVTFTDVSFSTSGGNSFTTGLLVMLFASYVVYFSLETSGERLGESTEDFICAHTRFLNVKGQIGAEDIPALRDFCYEYSRAEAEYRRQSFLAEAGLTESDLSDFREGKGFPKNQARLLRRCERIRPCKLTPSLLLSGNDLKSESELRSPEGAKMISLLLGLLPTTLGTFFTVSVILTAKSSLTPSVIMEGIFKLSALPIIGFKGYGAGYSYSKDTRSAWIDTKARILEQFVTQRDNEVKAAEVKG